MMPDINQPSMNIVGWPTGEYIIYYDNGNVQRRGFYLGGKMHGECCHIKVCGEYVWHSYYVAGIPVHDLLKSPLSDEEKVLLLLKHSSPK